MHIVVQVEAEEACVYIGQKEAAVVGSGDRLEGGKEQEERRHRLLLDFQKLFFKNFTKKILFYHVM